MRYQNKSNSILTMIQPKLKITKHSTPAEYQQIRKYVIDSVLESGCAPKRLASMREMAGFFKVSTATVQRALKELVDDDYLTVKPGIGLFTNPDRGWLREKTEVIGVLAADRTPRSTMRIFCGISCRPSDTGSRRAGNCCTRSICSTRPAMCRKASRFSP